MSKRQGGPEGFVVIDKPAAMTSHDVVASARKTLHQRQVGHAGTLDPDATGVLVIGVGRGTRLLRYVSLLEKSYRGEMVLGIATSTLDASGEVVARFDMSHITVADVERAVQGFVGAIEQIPPMVSAVRVDGQRLYKLARNGVDVDRKARPVTVSRYEVAQTNDSGVFKIAVTCSSGTFVRSLVADVGSVLGGGAHLRALRRSSIGPFVEEGAVPLSQLCLDDVRPLPGLVSHLSPVVVGAVERDQLTHGRVFEKGDIGVNDDGPWAIFDEGGEFVAVYESFRGSKMKPAVVFVASTETDAPSERSSGPSSVDGNGSNSHGEE